MRAMKLLEAIEERDEAQVEMDKLMMSIQNTQLQLNRVRLATVVDAEAVYHLQERMMGLRKRVVDANDRVLELKINVVILRCHR